MTRKKLVKSYTENEKHKAMQCKQAEIKKLVGDKKADENPKWIFFPRHL
jgi:hypothetical protein